MAKCYDILTGGFEEVCDKPLLAGLKRKGLIANHDDIASWSISGASNQFIPTMKDNKRFFPVEVLGENPFAGTNVASENDEWSRQFTKTAVLNLPESGSKAALKIEQIAKSPSGFVLILFPKDDGSTDGDGNFLVIGKDNPITCTVAKDYTAGVASPVITATTREPRFENFIFDTDVETTKALLEQLEGKQ